MLSWKIEQNMLSVFLNFIWEFYLEKIILNLKLDFYYQILVKILTPFNSTA